MHNAVKRAAKLTSRVKANKKKKVSNSNQCAKIENGTGSISSTSLKPLLSIGKLHQGIIVRRPSHHNKSPYVADVILDEDGTEVIVHAPMLDLGGIIKPGAVVRMTKSKPGGKTSHAIQLVGVNEAECKNKIDGMTWIGAHPSLGNSVAKALIEQGHLTEALLGDSKETISTVQSEVTMRSPDDETVRSDFVINENVVVEVKSCVCADYQKDTAPKSDKKDRYVTVISEDNDKKYQRTALFPIGKRAQKFEGEKVVSERCIKHLRHLSKIASGCNDMDDCEYKAASLLIIVNRGDCQKFRPCEEACPIFAKEFAKAISAGVRVVVAKVNWNGDGNCQFEGLLPVEA